MPAAICYVPWQRECCFALDLSLYLSIATNLWNTLIIILRHSQAHACSKISRAVDADGKYEVWLVLDTNTLMQSPEELLAFHSASKDSILPKSGVFKNIDLSINYYIPQAVIRELDNRKAAGHSDGKELPLAHHPFLSQQNMDLLLQPGCLNRTYSLQGCTSQSI